MNNDITWQIGMKASFNHDGLKATGEIASIATKERYVVIYLDAQDKDNGYGWTITPWDLNRYGEEISEEQEKYLNKLGWNVPIYKLKMVQTKLGNKL